ncbi:hypothetical protein GYMLUDRAFT_40154 [Collybiopsis luxurians FD-317 M1]|uniref:Uncharacterized protein n=1 Tax=Collybiopsis luxurians FD-317 M1 TaxID=944289 RepID=A0A0D0BIL4_9AGAR|nr:hypothetical protein GYMLUDRAFT_40154 [Collybiopsis luxurians FD-317 M1]
MTSEAEIGKPGETEDVIQITEEPLEEEDLSGTSSQPFPSVIEKTSPDSNATVSSALTYSDKLSALPPSVASPNPNRSGRSPTMNTHSHNQSARMFRRSLDASRSWPSISQSGIGHNFDSFSKLSPEVGATTGNGGRPRASTSEGSLGHDNLDETRQRASTESDRTSLPTMQSVRQALHRIRRGSDPSAPLRRDLDVGSRSPSHSRSRATSPLRILQQWSQGVHHRSNPEEPFIPVNPFQSEHRFSLPIGIPRLHLPGWLQFRMSGKNNTDDEEGRLPMNANYHRTVQSAYTVDPYSTNVHTHTTNAATIFDGHVHQADHIHHPMGFHMLHIFFLETLPRVLYLHILLRIPSMYFSRVSRVFEDAEVSKPDIQRMINACGRGGSHLQEQERDANPGGAGTGPAVQTRNTGVNPPSVTSIAAAAASVVDLSLPLPLPEEWNANPTLVSPALVRFKFSWETFIDSLMREWKTLNVVSALLLSAILTMFQINNAATDPLTRTAALLSLICALMSLSYGCIYIVRFATMRSMYRASIWAEEAQKTRTLVYWNVWVLLAMPAVWMSWSMILFITSIMSFVWRTGAESDPDERPPLSDKWALGPRIAITFVFFIGMVYFFLIVKTLRSYGANGRWRGRERMNAAAADGRNARSREDGTARRQGINGKGADYSMKDLRKDAATQGQQTPERGTGRLHAVDVVAEIMRGRQQGRSGRRRGSKTPDERGSRRHGQGESHPSRPLFGLGFVDIGAGGSGARDDSDIDLEKGIVDGN